MKGRFDFINNTLVFLGTEPPGEIKVVTSPTLPVTLVFWERFFVWWYTYKNYYDFFTKWWSQSRMCSSGLGRRSHHTMLYTVIIIDTVIDSNLV
ncbi:hypothetical protein RB195_009169 [Necator americanus]|uniref:Uncharacterized protein n=1 Tax=Necator americanus TaxID=51031 RepID=A0ABR1CS68_NECAM